MMVLHLHLLLLLLQLVDAANWAQSAGTRAQTTATPYTPDQLHRSPSTSLRPLWSGRWGHAVVVLNQSTARSYLTEEENSERQRDDDPVLVLLGGDDGLPRGAWNATVDESSEMGIGSGKLRNDVWVGRLAPKGQSSWRVDDRYFYDEDEFSPDLIRSTMRWREINPGRIAPATWTSGPKYSLPLTNDEWIACQDSIKDRLDFTLALPDPSVCEEPPAFCYEDVDTPGCHEQGMWKKDNMWSPRRGMGAVVANNKIYVVGGEAREYARIDDERLVGGLGGQPRIETMKEHSTIREEQVLKNDVWSSSDGGVTWELVNPGCKDPQEDLLLQTEVWSRNSSDPSLPKHVGSIGSKCYQSSDCYGAAECKALGNTHEKVCVCPLFSPRKDHAVAVQHRFSVQEDGSVIAEDVMYVVGGFTTVKQAFCANRSCGPADGYRLPVEDVWMSTDGVDWIQLKPAYSKDRAFRGRGGHTALIVPSYTRGNVTIGPDERDRLLIFGGETSSPHELSTTYLNDVWQVDLPKQPCCTSAGDCADTSIANSECLPGPSDWTLVTPNAEWSERSGHTTVYEPPSSSNSFRHRIYLSGGKDRSSVFSDVWTWDLDEDEGWRCDFCSDAGDENTTSPRNVFLSIDSPLADVKTFHLPLLDTNGELLQLTNRSASSIVSDEDVSLMAAEGIETVNDLASADLYTVLKLRGFDYPGREALEVANLCFLRAISLAIVEKCSIEAAPTSFFHKKATRRMDQAVDEPPPTLCGRGGETKPCVRGDWDGCTPIPGVTKVDVHGLGDVKVPQTSHDVSDVVEEMFCRQEPGGRYQGAAAFVDSKVAILGGIGPNSTLYRDVWSRDDIYPQAFITAKPLSRSPQSQFYFDSNEAGAHVFEYRLVRDGDDVIPWTITTKNIGADVAWLDDKQGGPGRGWYVLYVRAVDPSGNRDRFFSTQTNVYRWYYVPPIPWGAVAGCIITTLILMVAGYYEYRRRKRKATLQRFQLRRLRRKFKLKNATREVHERVFSQEIPQVINGDMRRRRSEAMESRHSSHRPRHRGDRSHSHSTHRGRGGPHSRSHSVEQQSRHSSHRNRRSHRSHSRSHRSRSRDVNIGGLADIRERRKKRMSDRAEAERRSRLRRDREKARRDLREHND
ncbi:hypothetical protein ACHAXT_005823 [Thalassiosira profunda]